MKGGDMRKFSSLLAIVVLTTTFASCGGGGGGGGGSASGEQTRTVLVDYRHDETETSMFDYYPRKVTMHPGDTVEFKQAWTGEPHSVTFGALVDPVLQPVIKVLKSVESAGVLPAQEDEPEEFKNFNLPFALDNGKDGGVVISQQAAQPCYVTETDTWPGDADTPCPKRSQPKFTGSDAIYSSGVIPYQGVGGNTFRVPISADAKPGTYGYYCNVHGPLQYGQLEIVAKGDAIPSKAEVAKTARREAESRTEVMVKNYKDAEAGKSIGAGEKGDQSFETRGKNLIGVPTPFFYKKQVIHGIINEFVPNRLSAKVNEKVTWTFAGMHTISFNVPKYFPVFTTAGTGRVEYNPKASQTAGWPGPPETPGAGGESRDGPPPEPSKVDAGTWDGRGFRSSGLNFPEGSEFSVTFTRAGTYPFACLIHPSMVGTIVVK